MYALKGNRQNRSVFIKQEETDLMVNFLFYRRDGFT